MHNRDIGIDLMKGLLMTLVVYVHTARTNSIMIDWFNTYKLAGFFIVSGLLLCSRGGNISVWRCIRRIIIPYFVFSFCSIVFREMLNIASFAHERTFIDLKMALQETFLFSGYLTLWFLPVLALGEVVLLWAIRLNIVFALLPLAGGLVILFPATIADLGSFSICLRVVARTIPAIFFLSVGYLIWPLYKESENCRKSLRVMIAIALIVFGFVASRFSPGVNWCGCLFGKSSLAFLLSGVFSSLGILTAFKLISYEIRLPWLEWVGRNSLLIMVFHFVIPFIFVARLIVEHVIGVKCVSALIACALVMVFQYPSIMAYNSVVNILRRKCFRHE